MYTSGTESRPKGVAALQPVADRASTSAASSTAAMSADDVEVHALPMYHCAQLDCFFCRRRLPRRDQHHPARPRPGGDPRDDRARAGHQALLPADGVDLAAAPPRLRHAPTCPALRKGYYGASPMPVEVLARAAAAAARTSQLWNFYGQTEMAPLATILRPARAAGAGRLGGPGGAQRRDPGRRRRRRRRCPPGRSARSCTAARTRRSATTTDEEKTAEAFARRLVPLRRPRGARRGRLPLRSSTARRT